MIGGGAVAMALCLSCRRVPAPLLDFSLLALPTFRASLLGGFLFRLGIGAMPFLLPLMLQIGFGMTPFQSGLITFASASARIGMKTVAARTMRRFGFRRVLIVNRADQRCLPRRLRELHAGTPVVVIFRILLVGGFFRSLHSPAINTIAYAEVDRAA